MGESSRKKIQRLSSRLNWQLLWLLFLSAFVIVALIFSISSWAESEETTSNELAEVREALSRSASLPEYVPVRVGNGTLNIPTHAALQPGLYKIGETMRRIDGEMERIEGYAHFHYGSTEALVEPRMEANLVGNCWIIGAVGAFWKVPEGYFVWPENTQGLSEYFIASAVGVGLSQWNEALEHKRAFNGRISPNPASDDLSRVDGMNSFHFGSISQDGVIAITITWGVFSGPAENRKIVEWDMIFDESDYNWGDSAVDGGAVMDLQNVVTHEAGHAAGMSDVPDASCTAVTMYAYSAYGELQKRTLESADIQGVRILYEQTVAAASRSRSGMLTAVTLACLLYMFV